MSVFWAIAAIALIIYTFRFISSGTDSSFNQLVGVYIGWVFVNLVAFAMSGEGSNSAFFPFDDESTYVYDFSELLVYCLGPIVFIFVRGMMRSKEN